MTNKTKILLKKYLPFAGLTILTIFLMVFFKVNSDRGAKIFEESKTILADFYLQNLKPLIYDSPITRDEVFDFAVNNQLPIDKNDNKSLKIGTDKTGEEYFQIIPTNEAIAENNYPAFKKLLSLNSEQEKSLDSILDSYKEDLYTAVFVNDDNTYAVNSELHLLKKIIAYDLYEFAYKVNNKIASPIKFIEQPEKIDEFVYDFRRSDKNNFIVFTQDTIVERALAFNKEGLEKDFKELQFNQEKLREELAANKFHVEVLKQKAEKLRHDARFRSIVVRKDNDSNKVIVVNDEAINFTIPTIDLSFINEITPKLKMNINSDSLKGKLDFVIDLKDNERDNFSFAIGINEKELNKLIQKSVSSVNNAKDWEEFGKKMDSLSKEIEFRILDSTFKIKVNDSPAKKSKIKVN